MVGEASRDGDTWTVVLPADHEPSAVPDLVADLVGLGVRVHAVESSRMTLENRLLGILRDGRTGGPR